MASSGHESLLPQVVESDLLDRVFEDVTDPTHRARWQDFARSNRVLAQEVLMRVCAASEGRPDVQKIIIDEISFVVAALATASQRLRKQHPLSTVGDGDEDLQLSI